MVVNNIDDDGVECGGLDGDIDLSELPMEELEGYNLHWSTITAETRGVKNGANMCLLCGTKYAGGPFRIVNHLASWKLPRVLKPCDGHLDRVRLAVVKKELRRREELVNAVTAKGEGIVKAKAKAKAVVGTMDKFAKVVKVEDIDMQMARVIASKGLAFELVDSAEFRKLLSMVARAGGTYLTPEWDVKLCHRTKMVTKVMVRLDVELSTAIDLKMQSIINECGTMIISDSWSSVAATNIINALACTPAGSRLLEAMDCHGITKSMEWTAEFIVKQAEKVGLANTVAVCMDGACKGAFEHINATKDCEHIFCFVCPPHSIDGFIGNVCSDKEEVIVGAHGEKVTWDEDIFSTPLAAAWENIKWITHHGKALACFRDVARNPSTWGEDKEITRATEFVKFCETRFASKVFMILRYLHLRPALEQFVVSPPYLAWLKKQPVAARESGAKLKKLVQDEAHWDAVELCAKCLEPAMVVMRMTDAKKGASLSAVYRGMLSLDKLYSNPIEGLDEDVRSKMHDLLSARWRYFHQDIFTAAYYLDPQAIHHDMDKEEGEALRDVFRKMATDEHPIGALMADYARLRTALVARSHGLNDHEAFSAHARTLAPWEWARTFLYNFEHVAWAAKRILSLRCSASECEHAWSIEGWLHSKKRNRLGQTNVERLLRVHTNLSLESTLEEWTATALPWDSEMIIDDPEDLPESADDDSDE
jgi:hypothetical protein